MTQLGGPVECPSLPPWCTRHDEPSLPHRGHSRNPSPGTCQAARATVPITGRSQLILITDQAAIRMDDEHFAAVLAFFVLRKMKAPVLETTATTTAVAAA